MEAMEDRTDEIIALMKGSYRNGYRHISSNVLAEFVRCEWLSNRWAMIAEPESQNILGWISWYILDDESLENVKEYGILGCFHKDIAIHNGNNLYLCNAVVREGVTSSIFRMLVKMAKAANPEATTINAHLRNRDDPVFRWSSFRMPSREKRLKA